VTFLLENVHNYLSPESDAVMEQVGVEYLTNFAARQHPDSFIFLYEGELLSQDMVSPQTPSLGNDLSANQQQANAAATTNGDVDSAATLEPSEPTYVHLICSVVFRGYGVDVQQANATALIIEGINSVGFTRAVQRSGDPEMVDALITTDMEHGLLNRTSSDPEAGQNPTESERNGAPSATIAAVVTICFLFVGAAVIGLFWYKRLGRRPGEYATASDAAVQAMHQSKDFISQRDSPAHSQKSPMSNAPALSFEQMLRLVASASPKKADDATTRTPSEHPEGDVETGQHALLDEADDRSKHSLSSRSGGSEHPLAGIIPPMIVIDNIEQGQSQELCFDNHVKERTKNVVPARHVEASPDFVAALAMGITGAAVSNSNNSNLFIREDAAPQQDPVVCAKELESEGGSHSSLLSMKENGNGVSGNSELTATPASEDDSGMALRHLVLEDVALHVSNDFVAPRGTESPASRVSRSSKGSKLSGTESSPQNDKEKLGRHQRSLSEASTVVAGPDTADFPTFDDDPKSGEPSPSESNPGAFFSSLWNRSPSRKSRPSAFREEESARRPSSTPMHRRTSSRSSSASSSDVEVGEDELEVVLHAPRTGKLGLVIQVKERIGPIVVQVKDYSPLLGQALPGDRLASIDGIRTRNLALSEVTCMLPGRQTSRWGVPVRLVVVRSRSHCEYRADLPNTSLHSQSNSNDGFPMLALRPNDSSEGEKWDLRNIS
jgi:hypothetical protein